MKNWKKKLSSGVSKSGISCARRFCRPKVVIHTLMVVILGYYVLVRIRTRHQILHNQFNANHHLKEPLLDDPGTSGDRIYQVLLDYNIIRSVSEFLFVKYVISKL